NPSPAAGRCRSQIRAANRSEVTQARDSVIVVLTTTSWPLRSSALRNPWVVAWASGRTSKLRRFSDTLALGGRETWGGMVHHRSHCSPYSRLKCQGKLCPSEQSGGDPVCIREGTLVRGGFFRSRLIRSRTRP